MNTDVTCVNYETYGIGNYVDNITRRRGNVFTR